MYSSQLLYRFLQMSLLFQIVLGMFLFKSYNLLFPSGALFISSVKSVLCFQSNATELQQLLLIATSSPMWQTNKCNNSTQKFISLSDAQCALGWVDFRFASPISFISYKRVSVIEIKKRRLGGWTSWTGGVLPPPLTDNHCAQKSLAERGGTPPLNRKNLPSSQKLL